MGEGPGCGVVHCDGHLVADFGVVGQPGTANAYCEGFSEGVVEGCEGVMA